MTFHTAVLLVASRAGTTLPPRLKTVTGLGPRRGVVSRRYLLVALDARKLILVALDALLQVDLAYRTVTLHPGKVMAGGFVRFYGIRRNSCDQKRKDR